MSRIQGSLRRGEFDQMKALQAQMKTEIELGQDRRAPRLGRWQAEVRIFQKLEVAFTLQSPFLLTVRKAQGVLCRRAESDFDMTCDVPSSVFRLCTPLSFY